MKIVVPEPRGELPGLNDILARVAELWRTRRDDAIRDSEDIGGALEASFRVEPSSGPLRAATLDTAFRAYRLAFDAVHGGFGGAPKFPMPANLSFLLRYSARTGNKEAREMVARTLRAMSEGGIHDRIGGGFHRYATDAAWKVPHYEKLLADNAQLAAVYLEAHQATRDPEHARVARKTLDYLLRDMARPGGGFHTAEDADEDYYSLPNAEARSQRPRPAKDDKILAGYNGLAVSALAKGARILDEPRYLQAAEKTASFLRENLYDAKTGILYRRWRDGERKVPGFAEDYAFTAAGLIDLYEADFDPQRLAWATRLAETQQALFYDEKSGGYHSTAAGQDEDLIVRPREDADGVLPS
ncbi:MAG: glycoside hydrolase family 88 protein, partial [Chloroflexota bacterium]